MTLECEKGLFKVLVNQIERQTFEVRGNIMRHRGIDNDLLTGMVFGKHSREQQKARLTNIITERSGLTMIEAITTAHDREKWRTIVYAATAIWEAECPNHW